LFVVTPSRGWIFPQLKRFWEYRELLLFLSWRDVKERYKQTILGMFWAILQPFITMVAFTIFFGKLGQLPSDGIQYALFTYTALLPWQLFSGCVTASANSLVRDRQLITKVYFPRLILPLSTVLVGLLDFGLAFTVLLALMAYYHVYPSFAAIALLPLFLLLAIATSLAVGIWLAALNVRYRDVQYTLVFMTQFWLFMTPVAYPSSLVPAEWRVFYSLNPMVGVVDGFRWVLLGTAKQPDPSVFVSMFITSILLAGGLIYFRRSEASFADVV
jgi:lipopolysaccharide transport system permease protein